MTEHAELPVAVIGAGGSGLLAASALQRADIEFEVLEARDGPGGTWRYDEHGQGSAAYASLVANTSKLRMSFAAQRIPGRPWEYATHAEMLAYIEQFVSDEGLGPRFRFGWRVDSAQRANGGWSLISDEGAQRRCRSLVFAMGVAGRPRFVALPNFTGEQLHSSAYRTPERFTGKDVLVVGLGTSGCEVAGEVAAVARSMRVSVRSPLWLMRRRLAGVPIDWLDDPTVARLTSWPMRRAFLKSFCRLTTGNLHRHGVPRPTRRCGDDVIAISDTFPRAVRRGLVQFSPAIAAAEGRRVSFADGSQAEAEVIVHATGFEPATDLLPAEARPADGGLYRGVMHPDVSNLFFVGLMEAHRALLPVVRDQANWMADVVAGRMAPPAAATQRAVAHREAEQCRRDFGPRRRFMVDHARYRAMLKRDRQEASSGRA